MLWNLSKFIHSFTCSLSIEETAFMEFEFPTANPNPKLTLLHLGFPMKLFNQNGFYLVSGQTKNPAGAVCAQRGDQQLVCSQLSLEAEALLQASWVCPAFSQLRGTLAGLWKGTPDKFPETKPSAHCPAMADGCLAPDPRAGSNELPYYLNPLLRHYGLNICTI